MSEPARILLAHGGGGLLTERLLRDHVLPILDNQALRDRGDAAVLATPHGRLAITTDGHVVTPLCFPGGDIGSLAVFGTANDLAMVGAAPLAITAALILEEGLEIELLRRVMHSMRAAADAIGTCIVAGDTKVVERGRADGMYITTTAVGAVAAGVDWRPARVAPGDVVIVSGDLGRHGAAILVTRADLAIDAPLISDCAPLWPAVAALLAAPCEVHALRDLTRGGLAAALHEIAGACGQIIELDEAALPVSQPVHDVCELLGLDPLHCACEGRFVAFVKPDHAAAAVAALRRTSVAVDARIIGRVTAGPSADPVRVRTPFGTLRILDAPRGEQLPRIC